MHALLRQAQQLAVKFGNQAARSVVRSIITTAVPIGGSSLANLVGSLFDATSEADLPPMSVADQARVESILAACEGNLSDLGERIAEQGEQLDRIRELIESALVRESEVRDAFEQIAEVANGMEWLQVHLRELLARVDYGNDLSEGMLELLRENQRIVVGFVVEARAAGLEPRRIIEDLSAVRGMLAGLIAGQSVTQERLQTIEQRFADRQKPAPVTTVMLQGMAAAFQGHPREAAQRLSEATRRQPDNPRLRELSRRVTQSLPPETPVIPSPSPSPVPTPEPLKVGDSIDGWVICRQLGFGGWGAVYEVERDQHKRAMKLLHPELSRDRDFVDTFKREIQSLIALHSPQLQPYLVVLDTFGYDLARGGWYLLMEYVAGESLQTRLSRDGVFSPTEAVELMAKLAGPGGLASVHERGMCHRDIKPANILVRPDGTPVLIDFGLALGGNHALTRIQRVTGYTVDYAAPEQLRGAPADARSDVYSLTATLWKLLTKRTPEDCDEDDLPPDLQSLRDVFRLGMHKTPAKRPATAAEWTQLLPKISAIKQSVAPPVAQPIAPPPPALTKRKNATLPDLTPGLARIGAKVNELGTLTGHSFGVSSVSFSPDGQTLASGSDDNTAKLWEVSSGKCLATLTGHSGSVYGVSYSPDGRTLATASWDKTAKLWEVSSGKCLATLTGHSGAVSSVSYSPDGRTLATASRDKTAKLWDVSSGKCIAILMGHSNPVVSVSFSPDGRTLATGSWDQTAKLWDVSSGKCLATLTGHSNLVWSVSYSPDGRTLATGSSDNTAKLWEVSSGKCLATLTGHSDLVLSVSYSPDGRTLATGSSDNTAKLWEVSSGKCLATLIGHSGVVLGVSFSPDRRTLATASADKTAKLWDLGEVDPSDWTYLEPLFTPRSSVCATLSGDGVVYPGEYVWLSFQVSNTGKGELVQVWAELRSALPLLNGLRAKLGMVKPGETAERCLAVILPADTPPGVIEAELVFHEANGHQPSAVPVRFEVQPLPRPDFQVSYRIINDDSGNSVGNGDGQPKRGETVDVAVTIRNQTGESLRNVRVTMQPVTVPTGVSISVPEQTLATLADDDSAEVRLTFLVKSTAEVGPVRFQLRVTTEDGRTFAVVPCKTSIV
ncbi:protein kinase domain-containing protein [Tuwongella immobilis]|uniref:Protein kinase domain-containing protein n=1 Tax=Tuwongella immobilis TaxID=692036 RepID=A0A6C2YIS5_9BACT|nr:protein kinase [Tuwongella immobilis]VIP01448.1 serine threonine protein kinase : Phosphotransferase enzyme family protein OS=Lyngbya aestuarii BL J GN=M595_0170 PE=4 SV=1: Pkinase: WD40: WD40: WD40: WD40: WD40: WD40: WD40 [Tuwongella immobilis]VTR98436.1 serine threonine protein kinase : Phosphotransferase enzyme family protein OS=Lyngbya aestuarii BL J GN=M595_0170 PE=4 SV=1: Pkinase: WD40: WD40: WD40: WD40: WD40: WD40: WD40 [Tuwongella immobilis]